MCGIFGLYGLNDQRVDPAVAERMGRVIRYRGPDDFGMHVADGVVLGNTRLSIIDVEGGHQPFVSADGKVAVVQNGEIYNYQELASQLRAQGVRLQSHCDTEVLLHLYLLEGVDFLRHLNGMFAIAVWDGRSRQLVLARDRIGVKPLYYCVHDRVVYFASEIKSLLVAGCSREIDHSALDHLLTYNYVPQPLTMFREIRQLPPGSYATVDGRGLDIQTWWRLSAQQTVEQDEKTVCLRFLDILEDAVRLRMRSDVPYGAFLSGGVDSSSVVGMMAAAQQDPVRTFSIGFADPNYDESPYALLAAERFATRHVQEQVEPNMLGLWPMVVYHCDQPHGDVSFMPTYRVADLAARDVKVVLTGDGGDELFAGYDKYRDFFSAADRDAMSEDAFRRCYFDSICLFDEQALGRLYTSEMREQSGLDAPYDLARRCFQEAGHFDRVNQALYLDMMLLLSGNNLVKPDRMGMAVSLEARTPFLDYRMMEFAFTVPGRLKLFQGETKYFFKKAVCDLIGEDLAYRKKQMFTVPVGNWFRSGTLLQDVLLDSRTTERGLFDGKEVRSLVEAHMAGRANHTRELRMLVALELWSRIFLDGPVPESAPEWADLGLERSAAGLAVGA